MRLEHNPFDRQPYIQILAESGMQEEIAIGIAKYLTKTIPEAVATKEDLRKLDEKITGLEKRVESVKFELLKWMFGQFIAIVALVLVVLPYVLEK